MDSWSLEIALVIRRLREDPEIVWGPGGRGGAWRGGVRTQRFFDRSGDLSCNPEVFEIVIGPLSRVRIQGFPIDPEIVSGPWCLHLDPEVAWEPGDPKIFDWNPEVLEVEPGDYSLDPEIFDWNPEAIGEPGGTVLRLPRQDYYRKSLTCFRGCWCGCYDPSARLRCFPRLEKQDFDCSMYFTVVSTAYSGLHIPVPALCLIPILILWSCHCGRATVVVPLLQGFARIGGLWRPDPARMPL
ncbi:hypothetical protein F2Q69_00005852 [Brassica cretica]|uniref:Uncharacterized protein n=1 Tax=Brassica cretica TaxID=69181 RepID=A0A8S9PKW6_BRACR|nr:hypothetical protein F2Q69_00005852 [Brassica cretica]